MSAMENMMQRMLGVDPGQLQEQAQNIAEQAQSVIRSFSERLDRLEQGNAVIYDKLVSLEKSLQESGTIAKPEVSESGENGGANVKCRSIN